VDYKFLPLIFRFIVEKNALELSIEDQIKLQNFIMFVCSKQNKSKRKKLTKYSLLANGGHDFEEESPMHPT